ncbi:thiol-disulfide oxidoreductase [Limnochorda pilosa]|nr:thiol-disulfide oxidoreductase [Limnochorda pilosa]BAS26217.1 thiol-disulfide oxidoreductase [Limnochorda pilosa]
MARVVVPHPMGMIKPDEIRAKADAAFAEILNVATGWQPSAAQVAAAAPPYPAPVIRFTGTDEDVNELFFRNGWSVGLPIIPPTPERVQAMLKGTSHRPDEVIGMMTPRMGAVTVELVAVHAVMAGCKPDQMPVLLAAVEALVDPSYRGPTTTTNPTAPLVVVNGPIVDEVGIAYGQGAAGPSQQANVCLGHAINLIGDVIGGSRPPEPDKTTLGWPGNTVAMVIAENEQANPWGPLHVERGFNPGDSIVTVMTGAEIPANINDHNSITGEDLLRVIAHSMDRAGQNTRCFSDSDVLVILSPEHAATIFSDGWKSKDEMRRFLWENSKVPFEAMPGAGAICKPPRWFGSPGPGDMIPIVSSPERIQLIVSGGAGKHSVYVSSFGAQTPRLISVSADKWR